MDLKLIQWPPICVYDPTGVWLRLHLYPSKQTSYPKEGLQPKAKKKKKREINLTIKVQRSKAVTATLVMNSFCLA